MERDLVKRIWHFGNRSMRRELKGNVLRKCKSLREKLMCGVAKILNLLEITAFMKKNF